MFSSEIFLVNLPSCAVIVVIEFGNIFITSVSPYAHFQLIPIPIPILPL